MSLDISENEGTSEKECVEIEDWGFSVHFALGFQENSIYTYVFAKILHNSAKFIQKLTSGFKNHMKNLNNSRQVVESSKSWNLTSFCLKNTFLQLKHYIQRIYLTLLSTTCVKIYQIIENIFENISHFSRHNSSASF